MIPVKKILDHIGPIKKAAGLLFLAAAAAVSVAMYASAHLALKAQALELVPEARLVLLDRAGTLYPLNDSSYQQAGLALLDRAANNLGDIAQTTSDLGKAYVRFRKALRLNPGSATAHFYYAKTLTLMRYLGLDAEDNPFQELQKAARLAGSHQQMDKDIGTALLSQWGSLSAEEREFTTSLLRKSLHPEDTGAFEEVLNLWDLNIRDYTVMDAIVPPSPTLLRMYARFLGEKSLSLSARRKALAQAEALEYGLALKDYEAGQGLIKYGRTTEAAQRFASSLGLLNKIRFYGYLSGEPNVGASAEKKTTLQKTVLLELAKARLEDNRNMAEAEGPFREYLAMEQNYDQVADLESYLKLLRILPETGPEQSIKNIHDLAFQVSLMFKLHKYRQIVSLGTQLQRSLLVPDDQTKRDLSEIFQLVGDSYLKLDFVYESETFYQNALELTPKNLDVLLRMKKYYERRNDVERIREVDRQLKEVLTAGRLLSRAYLLAKGAAYSCPLVLDVSQKRIRLEITFDLLPSNPRPLVSIFLNGRVYWEDFVGTKPVTVEMGAQEGINQLQVAVVNGPASLTGLDIEPIAENQGPGGASFSGQK
jgi:tetratricopeptide (TPR) repeat protein